MFRVTRGTPTAEELAALVGVLSARTVAARPEGPPARPAWRAREAQVGAPLKSGPGAWRASGLPR